MFLACTEMKRTIILEGRRISICAIRVFTFRVIHRCQSAVESRHHLKYGETRFDENMNTVIMTLALKR